jgi:hypothetical protein
MANTDTDSNRNFMVRMENSNVSQNEMSVMPLYSMRTGAEIPGCPATLAEFNALTGEFRFLIHVVVIADSGSS